MVFSTGAGAEMRSVMGIAVFSGMLGVTFFGLFFTPMFYVLLRKLEGKRKYHQQLVHGEDGQERTGDHHPQQSTINQHEVKV
jgi:multidrug efflux pump